MLTLNWILNSKEFGTEAGLGDEFDGATEDAVESLQEVAEISRSGVVDEDTRAALVKSMRKDGASWYGPGLYGNSTACGHKFSRKLVGVAHKTLPCGTKVVLKYKNRFLRTEVVDRGPYIEGRRWDLTYAAQQKMQIPGVATIRSAIVRAEAPLNDEGPPGGGPSLQSDAARLRPLPAGPMRRSGPAGGRPRSRPGSGTR